MLESVIVLLDAAAVSFCHYDGATHGGSTSGLMPRELLAWIVHHAASRNLSLTVLFGMQPVPDEHLRLLDEWKHVKIVPYALRDRYEDAVLVLDWDGGELPDAPAKRRENVIVRLPRSRLADWRPIFRLLQGSVRRINLTLTGLGLFTERDLLEYEHQLVRMVETVAGWYLAGQAMEVSCISDRLFLTKMRNCDAGVRHVTFAPSGKFCPGFYHADPGADVGTPGAGIRIPDAELLGLERAPLCSSCDAYQCRRCVFLSKTTTGEWNTPSRQQCVSAHLERNSSRRLLRRLKPAIVNFEDLADIPEIDYLDPLELTREERRGRIGITCT